MEIYHLKAADRQNWSKVDQVIAKVNAARAAGIDIRANMYTYIAGGTGLNAAMPPWVQEGGYDAWVRRMRDPQVRARLRKEMETPTDAWEHIYQPRGSCVLHDVGGECRQADRATVDQLPVRRAGARA